MTTIINDIKFSMRQLIKRPGFTAVTVLTLALGIGANTAIFSIVDTVLFRPLSFRTSNKLVAIRETNVERGWDQISVSPVNFIDWRNDCTAFEGLAAFHFGHCNLTGVGQPRRVGVATVSASFFTVLGAQPALGRTFAREEDRPDTKPVAILDHGFWKSQLGSDLGVIGKELLLNGAPFVVIGVMPHAFSFPLLKEADIWCPLVFHPDSPGMHRGNHYLSAIARLKPNVTVKQAQAEMDAIAHRLQKEYPKTNAGFGVVIIRLQEQVVANIRLALLVLLGAIGLVLLVACVNVATMILAQASGRQKEIAIRTAVGASWLRVLRQFLTESVLLALIGGGLGFLVTSCGLDLLVAFCPEDTPRLDEVRIDGRVLAFTLTISLLAGAAFALAPALQISRSKISESLKEGGRRSVGSLQSQRIRSVLVTCEIALALMLLIEAGLMIRSFLCLVNVSPGFSLENLLTCEVSLPSSRYPEAHQRSQFVNALLERIQNLPGIRSVASVNHIPLGGGSVQNLSFTIEDRPAYTPEDVPTTYRSIISSDYFRVMGIPIFKGRGFTERDSVGTSGVLIINEAMAKRFWGDDNPVGKRLKIGAPWTENPWLTIVGVVGNVRHRLAESAQWLHIYEPHAQDPVPYMRLVMRVTPGFAAVGPAVREQVTIMDKDLPVSSVRTMEHLLRDSVSQPRFSMLLLGVFAATALLLSAVGVYGVMACSVSQRIHEFGIRMALGARHFDVLKCVMKRGLILVTIGVSVGIAGAVVLTRATSSLLYGISPTDPITFLAVSLLLIGTALLACYIPARRAARIDPMVALRYE